MLTGNIKKDRIILKRAIKLKINSLTYEELIDINKKIDEKFIVGYKEPKEIKQSILFLNLIKNSIDCLCGTIITHNWNYCSGCGGKINQAEFLKILREVRDKSKI
jgi:hypothetical protein